MGLNISLTLTGCFYSYELGTLIDASFYLIALPFHNIVKCFIHLNYFPGYCFQLKGSNMLNMYMHVYEYIQSRLQTFKIWFFSKPMTTLISLGLKLQFLQLKALT